MSGKRSRTKGHDWEREIVRDMTEARGVPYTTARRSAVELDALGVDVFAHQDAFVIQAKVGKRPNVRAALREIASDPEEIGRFFHPGAPAPVPVAAIRWNRGNGMEKDDVAVLRWTDFLRLIANVYAPRERPDLPSPPEDGIESDGERAP